MPLSPMSHKITYLSSLSQRVRRRVDLPNRTEFVSVWSRASVSSFLSEEIIERDGISARRHGETGLLVGIHLVDFLVVTWSRVAFHVRCEIVLLAESETGRPHGLRVRQRVEPVVGSGPVQRVEPLFLRK